jgi:hypothetical protein
MQEIARRLHEPDLLAAGIHSEGRALIRSGHVADGLSLLDEAMLTVLDGKLAPFITGILYCHTIAVCHEVADVRRMTRRTELAGRWLATFPAAVAFGGLTCFGLRRKRPSSRVWWGLFGSWGVFQFPPLLP